MVIFFASFSKSQSTNWTTIGVNKQFLIPLNSHDCRFVCDRVSRSAWTRPSCARNRECHQRAHARSFVPRAEIFVRFLHASWFITFSIFSCRRKPQRPTSCDVDNIHVELRLWLLAENKHGIDSIVKTIKGTWLKSKDYYKARDDTVHKADDNLLQCSIDLTDLLRLKDFTTGRQFPNHVS